MQPVDAVQDEHQRPNKAEKHFFVLGVFPILHLLVGYENAYHIDNKNECVNHNFFVLIVEHEVLITTFLAKLHLLNSFFRSMTLFVFTILFK